MTVEDAKRPPAAAAERRMSLEDQHEVEQDERRRVVTALVYGQEASSDTPVPGAWGALLAGVAVSLAAVLLVAMGTLVRSSLPTGKPTPSPRPSISVPASLPTGKVAPIPHPSIGVTPPHR
jgi:hypothetical protein